MRSAGNAVESGLTVTATSSVGQIVANSGADHLGKTSEGQHGPTSAAPTLETPAPPAFGLVLHYDRDMHHLILEARDPVSGFVLFEIPQKSAAEQFVKLHASTEEARGASVNCAV
jgi:hypothetical protein